MISIWMLQETQSEREALIPIYIHQTVKEYALDITKYTGYFHDGALLEIDARNSYIILSLESAEINPMEIGNIKILSKSNTLFGKLHLKNVTAIKINQELYTNTLSKSHDDGEILDLEIYPGKILLLIQWTNFPPKPKTNDVSRIEIEAEEIHWENIPSAKGYKFHDPASGSD
jgi:hypothetical protein